MFEKFTEKAINAITEAQNQAKLINNACVQPEHLLLAIVKQSKGIPLKLFRMYGIKFEEIQKAVENRLRFEKSEKKLQNLPFSDEFKDLLKNSLDLANKSGNSYVLFEHLFLAVINDKISYNRRILENFGFDFANSEEILLKLVQKKTKKLSHPEVEESKDTENHYLNADFAFEGTESVFEKAFYKLSASNYEMLGTEQIISAILEGEPDTAKILEENGIRVDNFREALSEYSSREAEYNEKHLIFTPSAFCMMNLASQTAKELGSSQIRPEHIILGLLKAKKGIAYDILKNLNINDDDLAHSVLKPIEKQMPQALTILRLAKQEARRLGRNVVGTEMFLLGIISEGIGVGFKVLNDLEINLKDARQAVEKLIGYGNEYYDKEVIFTKRAKKILETAWLTAKKYNQPRILSEHLLYAITTEPSSVAMKALAQLGVDALEIRQGILKG
ncbi:MAG: Clp protease N-terminal domain-containing protein [Candidatus Gastranaerophilaceae bacterium]